MENYFPHWLNHVNHTFAGITVWLEEWLYFHERENRKSFSIFITFGFYFIWFLYIKLAFNRWVYPIFNISLEKRIILFIAIGFFALICFSISKYAHQKLWPKTKKDKKR